MRLYKDAYFWICSVKFLCALLIGLGAATLMIGISVNTALAMGIGGILGFPAAFAFGSERPRQLTH